MKSNALKSVRLFAAALLTMAAAAYAQQSPTEAGKETPAIVKGLPTGTYAWFKTNHGEFVAKLFTDLTPKTAENFIGLAEGTKAWIDPKTGNDVKRPFYDGLIFHRIIPNFMIQGGDPEGTGRGGPGYRFKDEIVPSLKFERPGLLAMANSGPNTNGSQFFITVAPYPSLTGGYSLFGEIAKGMDVVVELSKVQTGPEDRPVNPVVMEKVKIYRVTADAKAGDAPTTGSQTK